MGHASTPSPINQSLCTVQAVVSSVSAMDTDPPPILLALGYLYLVSSRKDRSRVVSQKRVGDNEACKVTRYAYQHGKPELVSCKVVGTTERDRKVLRCAPTTAQAAAACGRRWVLAGTELLQLRRRSLDQTQDYLVYPDRDSRRWSALEP